MHCGICIIVITLTSSVPTYLAKSHGATLRRSHNLITAEIKALLVLLFSGRLHSKEGFLLLNDNCISKEDYMEYVGSKPLHAYLRCCNVR